MDVRAWSVCLLLGLVAAESRAATKKKPRAPRTAPVEAPAPAPAGEAPAAVPTSAATPGEEPTSPPAGSTAPAPFVRPASPAPVAPASPAPGAAARAAAPTPAVAAPALAPAARGLWATAMVGPGFSLQGGQPALTVAPRVAFEVTRLERAFPVEVVLSVYLGYATTTTMGITATALGLSVVPGARVSFPLAPKLTAYTELGVGVGHYRLGMPVTFYGYLTSAGTGVEFAVLGGL